MSSPSALRVLAVGALLAICVLAARVAHRRASDERAARPRVETHPMIPPPGMARLLAMGYNELAADIAWSRTLVYYGDGLAKGFSLSDIDPLVRLVNALD